MQPYFFPYVGYFSLIASCDHWVVLDLTQYTPKSWMNRNRVLHPVAGWSYVGAPVAGSSRSLRVFEARLADPAAACRRALGQLSHYRRRAPHWRQVEELVRSAFAGTQGSLVELDLQALRSTCAYLGVPFRSTVASLADLRLPVITSPGGWAPAIAESLGATQYLNPIGGRHLFDPQDFSRRGIELLFLRPPELVYDPSPYGFEPALSVLDVLMWNEPATVRAALLAGQVLPAERLGDSGSR